MCTGSCAHGPYSSESSIDDAEALAANLGISNITVPICEPFEAFEAVLARACGGALHRAGCREHPGSLPHGVPHGAFERPRLLMLNTGNKSEAAMGYSTLYGDTAGAFAPLGGSVQDRRLRHGSLAQPPGRGGGSVRPHSRERVRETAERGARAPIRRTRSP